MTTRVLHLVGSAVSPLLADLSRLYAEDCLASAVDPAMHEDVLAHVSPGGRWRFPTDLSDDGLAAAEPLSLDAAVRHLAELRPDVAVPQMFCLPGMTTYRGLLDLLQIPYPGNTPEVMALAAHKQRAKSVVAGAGVPTPRGVLLSPGEAPPDRWPTVVKPVDADNSSGVSLVRAPGDYAAALEAAFAESSQVLVEDYVELGREVRCGVLEVEGELRCLPLEEYAVDAGTKPIRGYDDKLRRGADDGALSLVAKDAAHAWIVDPEDPITPRVWEVAKVCHRALGCRDYSLFDFRIDPEGRPWFLEAGLYCSFAEKSVVAVMAKAAGIDLRDLFSGAVDQALSRRTQPVGGLSR